ncbi:Fic family protein [Lacisediminimonas sp.]|uniref:Fic family protein n=1 Tax=Lacisediminimonas sp. TaxID=3060582 RepID=UPI0027250D2A|nr:Fic family protein [Lacisediminimonas sp.]MDO8299990.1 Fic family protein [Lacisediminimonas sp.]
MPKVISPEELDQLAGLIARSPDGVDIDQLLASTLGQLSRRTLQRRIAELVAQGRVTPRRAWRAVKYQAVHTYAQPVIPDMQHAGLMVRETDDFPAPATPEGEQIQAYVRQPVQKRRPVGYHIAFLEAYQPNQTFCLPANLREQLHSMGRSPVGQAAAGTFARDIFNRLLIDLSWASSRLEGNTYSRLDTEKLIQFGQAASGKDSIETQMILNHKAAIEYLVHDAEHLSVNTETIVALHALLSDGLLADRMACGRLRRHAVQIAGSVYLPNAVPQSIEELFALMTGMANEIDDPFEQAFFLMVHLPYLQAFDDVNKRVSRLAANIPLIRANLCPLSFIDVPQRPYIDALLGVYEMNRIELLRDVFVGAYERSCQQYVAVRSQLVPPDLFRLRHRVALAQTMRAIVQGGLPPTENVVRQSLPPTVPLPEQEHFIRLVREEFGSLHAGNAVRFGLHALEFMAWEQKHRRN